MKKIVLLRHGESAWNKENRFTGWTDVDLTEKGVAEAVSCLLYTSPSPRDRSLSRMPSSA